MLVQKNVVVRLPADTLADGITMHNDRGAVDVIKAKRQHTDYCAALAQLGYKVQVMDTDPKFPDCVYPEDPAIILQNEKRRMYIVTRLQNQKRQGEEEALKQFMVPKHFLQEEVFYITPPGFIEGGDVLVTDTRLYVGLSERTNYEGASQLAYLASNYFSLPTEIIPVPKSWLHLKGGCSYHRREGTKELPLILTSKEIVEHFRPYLYDVITISKFEHDNYYGPNAISEGNNILVHKGAKETANKLNVAGFVVKEVDLHEYWKIDGAMSCLSKIWESPVV